MDGSGHVDFLASDDFTEGLSNLSGQPGLLPLQGVKPDQR